MEIPETIEQIRNVWKRWQSNQMRSSFAMVEIGGILAEAEKREAAPKRINEVGDCL